MKEKTLQEKLEFIAVCDLLCGICLHRSDCSGGASGGPNGPIFPPCADKGVDVNSGLFDEDAIEEKRMNEDKRKAYEN